MVNPLYLAINRRPKKIYFRRKFKISFGHYFRKIIRVLGVKKLTSFVLEKISFQSINYYLYIHFIFRLQKVGSSGKEVKMFCLHP